MQCSNMALTATKMPVIRILVRKVNVMSNTYYNAIPDSKCCGDAIAGN